MGRELPAPTALFRRLYTNAKKIKQSGQVAKPQFERYIYHQIGRLEGMLASKGKFYQAEVIQGFIDFQKRMEKLLPQHDRQL
jgi:hypothetical protein